MQHLKDAQQRIWVLSPWLGVDNVDFLLNKKAAGLDVKVFTTNNFETPGHITSLRNLIDSNTKVVKPESIYLKYSGITSAISGLIIFISSSNLSWLGVILMLAGIFIWYISKEKIEEFWFSRLGDENLKIFNKQVLVHAKIYIADNWVIIGSANFTRNGLVNSMESMIEIQDSELASRAITAINGVQNTPGIRVVSYKDVGLYQEGLDHRYKYKRRWRYKFRRASYY